MYKILEKLLCERGISAYRMCKDIGISPVTISDWKHGKSKPKIDKIMQIANFFDVDIGLFLQN